MVCEAGPINDNSGAGIENAVFGVGLDVCCQISDSHGDFVLVLLSTVFAASLFVIVAIFLVHIS